MSALQPGPYVHKSGRLGVLLMPSLDPRRLVTLLTSGQGHRTECDPNHLRAADDWPDWWPWPDTPLPVREIQVGDFVRGESEDAETRLVIGTYFGRIQSVFASGLIASSLPHQVQVVDRPHDWPEDPAIDDGTHE